MTTPSDTLGRREDLPRDLAAAARSLRVSRAAHDRAAIERDEQHLDDLLAAYSRAHPRKD